MFFVSVHEIYGVYDFFFFGMFRSIKKYEADTFWHDIAMEWG